MGRAFDIRWLIGAGMALLALALVWDASRPAPARAVPADDGYRSLDVALVDVRAEHERAARATDPGPALTVPAPPAGCGARYALPLDPEACPDAPEADADGEISTGVAGACGIRVTAEGAAWTWDVAAPIRGRIRCTAGSCRSPALDLRDGADAPAGLSHAWTCP